jgi:hypothetical protein
MYVTVERKKWFKIFKKIVNNSKSVPGLLQNFRFTRDALYLTSVISGKRVADKPSEEGDSDDSTALLLLSTHYPLAISSYIMKLTY